MLQEVFDLWWVNHHVLEKLNASSQLPGKIRLMVVICVSLSVCLSGMHPPPQFQFDVNLSCIFCDCIQLLGAQLDLCVSFDADTEGAEGWLLILTELSLRSVTYRIITFVCLCSQVPFLMPVRLPS